MTGVRHRATRIAGIGALLALLLVPIALAGHAHQDDSLSRSCATCVVVHHAPALVTVAPSVLGFVTRQAAPPNPALPIVGDVVRASHAGRSPPRPPSVLG
jgi:hypothetical protein